jgi:prepilin-type N-terminal cleavage/methylation domain-containing protein
MMRAGFTLFEVMVAIVVTSVVAMLGYGTATAAFETDARVEAYHATTSAQLAIRSFLFDALRHPTEQGGPAMNDALLTIENQVDSNGIPFDELRFLSRGVISPMGTSDTWLITVTSSSAGIHLRARPRNAVSGAPVDIVWPKAYGLNVRVLDRTESVIWLDSWDVVGRVPAAVAIQFWSRQGQQVAAPLVVHASLQTIP